jgi:nucleoside phosphorylase
MIFAMGFEMSAFRYMLDEEHEMAFDKEPGDQNQYILGKAGRHNVVLACLPGEQGKGAAAMAAKDLGRTFQAVEWRLLVGIGGGVPSPRHDIRLGDVVVSMPHMEHGGVVQYDLGRATDGRYQLKGFLRPPPAYLRNVVGQMESNHLAEGNMVERFVSVLQARGPRLHRQYQRPPSESDDLFRDYVPHNADSASCEGCDASGIVTRPQRPADEMTEIHYGLIASGDTVVASTTARQEIIADVLCFEMEAAGIMSGYECLVIRGISDYADSHKCRHWRHYAAAAAAACAKELLMLARPTATATLRELPISSEKAGRDEASASARAIGGDRGDRGQIQGGNYSVDQGLLAMGNSNVRTGNWTFGRPKRAEDKALQYSKR